MRDPNRTSYDAVVVGARCAGAATALQLARRGLRVLVVDRSRRGTDTLSTHALMRGGVLQLHRWGLLDAVRAAGTPPVRQTIFHYGDRTIDVAIQERDGVDALYAPRRVVLDAILADAAEAAGAELLFGAGLADVIRDADDRVRGVVLEDRGGRRVRVGAGIVIGADGRRSTVARRVGAETRLESTHATGTAYGYWSGLPLDAYHWYYRRGVSAGVIPTNDGEACVFATVPGDRFDDALRHDIEGGYHRVLERIDPELAAAVRGARRSGPFRAFPGQRGHLRRSHGPGWALVGDAAYFKDPLTAHGITDALRDAELLADAVAAGTPEALAGYEATRDDVALGFFVTTNDVASFDWDLPELQELHKRMSREMAREVDLLRDLDPKPEAVAA